jgi:hypothetical protein
MAEDTTSLLVKGISKKVKAKFKAWCANNNIPMYKKLEDLMRKTIKIREDSK